MHHFHKLAVWLLWHDYTGSMVSMYRVLPVAGCFGVNSALNPER